MKKYHSFRKFSDELKKIAVPVDFNLSEDYEDVTIRNETLSKGQTFKNCKLINCKNEGATVIDSEWIGGVWEDGAWKDGRWKDGKWIDGTWYSGTWIKGTWISGTWYDGIWEDGWIYDPGRKGRFQAGWEWSGDYVHSSVSPKEYFEGT